jgi:hypothetical protein
MHIFLIMIILISSQLTFCSFFSQTQLLAVERQQMEYLERCRPHAQIQKILVSLQRERKKSETNYQAVLIKPSLFQFIPRRRKRIIMLS